MSYAELFERLDAQSVECLVEVHRESMSKREVYLDGGKLKCPVGVLVPALHKMAQLEILDLANNQLTALPESLGQLTQLKQLSLANNQLTALPESLGQLTQLQTLGLANNHLTALPQSLGRLTQLQTLSLFHNQLTALPESLGQLTRLQELDLSRNQLAVVPEYLGRLMQLRKLDLSSNPLAEDSLALSVKPAEESKRLKDLRATKAMFEQTGEAAGVAQAEQDIQAEQARAVASGLSLLAALKKNQCDVKF